MECVLLKIKKNSLLDLIKLGCFEGNEKLIRITKGENHTITIFTDKGHYSWEFGEGGYTIVTKNTDKKKELILDCIENDFDIYINSNKELIKRSLNICSLKDTCSISHDIKIMYWDDKKETNVIVYKDGDFFRNFSGISEAKKCFKNSNFTLNFRKKYADRIGHTIEEYSMIKKEISNEKNSVIEQKNSIDIDYNYD